MRIEGDGWVLRPERVDDAADMARAFAEDPHLAVDWGIDDVLDEQAARDMLTSHVRYWDEGQGRHLAVADRATDALLGGVNFHNIRLDHNRAEVGFWLVPWARGRGIGGGAVAAACLWAFDNWSLARIEMTTLTDNEGSLAVASKLGFTREGVMRARNFERGKQVDLVLLSLLRGELRQP
jgi:ribosomal-protein-alanine N-acetyltransferase